MSKRKRCRGVDVLAVLALLSVIVALLVPALTRSIESPPYRQFDCQFTLHRIANGIEQWRADHNRDSPVTVDFSAGENPICGAWGRIYSAGYCEAEDAYVWPPSDEYAVSIKSIRRAGKRGISNRSWTLNAGAVYALVRTVCHADPHYGPAMNYDAEYMSLLNSRFNYDNARIHKNSAAGRIIAGDGLERQWMHNAHEPSLDSGLDESIKRVRPNHKEGAHVVFDDMSVAFVKRELIHRRWIPYQTDAVLAGSTTSLETEPDHNAAVPGPDRPFLGDSYDWVRQGVIQNPRIEEDDAPNGKDEHDDAYAIEGATGDPDMPDQWWMLSEFQFETGVLVGGRDWLTDGHGRITDTKNSVEGMEYVPKSKIDASIQPFRHYRPGTGQPDDGNDCEFGLSIDLHGAGNIWEY
jgi:hypothetical protein